MQPKELIFTILVLSNEIEERLKRELKRKLHTNEFEANIDNECSSDSL
jgi:hypothetical protein